MTEPRPHRPREAVDEPLRPAANIAEPTSLVPAAPPPAPQPVRAVAGEVPPVGGAADSRTPPPERRGGALLPWGRASLAIAAAGSLLALGTRALFERVMGPMPYDLPSDGAILAAIALASATGAALLAWTSETQRQPAPVGAPRSWSGAINVSYMTVAMTAVFMLNGAYRHAGEIDASRGLELPLAVVERRAELRPLHIPSQYALGVAYYQAGRYHDAGRSLEYVREMEGRAPHDPAQFYRDRISTAQVFPRSDLYARAMVLSILADAHLAPAGVALPLYRQAYDIGGPSAEASRALYDALVAAGRYGEARIVAGTYLRLHPLDQSWAALYRSAWDAARQAEIASLLPMSGAANAEIARFKQKARSDPKDPYPEAYLAFAELKEVLGTQLVLEPENFDRALNHARRAVELAPRNADYQAQLGLIQALGQHWSGADSAFAAAVAIDPRVLKGHEGFDAAWETARARMRGDAGAWIQPFVLAAPRKP